MNETLFIFGEWQGSVSFGVEIPQGLKSKATLLEALGMLLGFPDYYGANWDSFEECIRDLSWLPEGAVVIKHIDLPLENDSDLLKIYLEILKDAVAKWSHSEAYSLIVVFPAYFKNRIESLILGA